MIFIPKNLSGKLCVVLAGVVGLVLDWVHSAQKRADADWVVVEPERYRCSESACTFTVPADCDVKCVVNHGGLRFRKSGTRLDVEPQDRSAVCWCN